MSLFRKPFSVKKDRSFSVLDVGTESVKVLVAQAKDHELEILGKASEAHPLREMEGGVVTDLAGVIERSLKALKTAERMAGVSPSSIILGFGGELIRGATSQITYRRRDPQSKIHQEELKNIIHKVQWKAFEKVRSDLAYDMGLQEIDVKLVHAGVVDTRVDGYKVSNPIGFQGREIAMSLFNAFSPLLHFGAIQTLVAELDREVLAIMAEPYALGRVLGGTEMHGYSGIFIDVGGTMTDLAIVHEGAVVSTQNFHLGGRSFTKRLAHSLSLAHEEAEQIKIAFSSGELEHQSFGIVKKALESDTETWLTGIYFALQEVRDLDSLPSTIYLCGGGAQLPLLKEALERPDWLKSLPFPRKPQVKLLVPKMISSATDPHNLLDSCADMTPLALAHMGMDILLEEKTLTKMLQKVVRLMQV